MECSPCHVEPPLWCRRLAFSFFAPNLALNFANTRGDSGVGVIKTELSTLVASPHANLSLEFMESCSILKFKSQASYMNTPNHLTPCSPLKLNRLSTMHCNTSGSKHFKFLKEWPKFAEIGQPVPLFLTPWI